ncbi:MAG: hypothetical protein JNK58_08710 [Phycisphaerae bacterium]|nr:hypothetical protein [Phycisphaerae bacterium]
MIALLGGCGAHVYKPDPKVHACLAQGDYGQARLLVESKGTPKKDSRRYALDRLQRLTLCNAEGIPDAADPIADQAYDFLRTQGVNDDKTAAAVAFGGGNVRIWKGEPFEQAAAYAHIAIHDAMQGEWGNARASASNSLFLLRDFSKELAEMPAPPESQAPSQGQQTQPHAQAAPPSQIIQQKQYLKATSEERRKSKKMESGQRPTPSSPGELEVTYATAPSDFEIGYVLKAIAARSAHANEEVLECLSAMRVLRPNLSGLASRIGGGRYNMVLVVDYGMAPRKIGAGYLSSYTEFVPVTPSDDRLLVVRYGGISDSFPVVTDLNAKTSDLKWHAEEDLSLARAYTGTGLAAAGTAVAASSNDTTTQIVGLIAAGIGGYLMATSAADTTYCDLLAQRTYVALLELPPGGNTVEVMIDGRPETRLVLPGLKGSVSGEPGLRYVRLPEQPGEWAQGQLHYSNTRTGPAPGSQLPYILGGYDASPPTEDMMSIYHSHGLPADVDLATLRSVYVAEGIAIEGIDPPTDMSRHILEGGTSLYTPLEGTVGFARLFCQTHPPYQPRSAELRSLRERVQSGVQTAATSFHDPIGGAR